MGPGGGAFTASTTSFTFGCRHTAIAKCVELGYKPWATKSGVLLRNHHLSCIRMLRADYCGNGQPWTVTGTQINVYDNLAIQVDTLPWVIDAEWGPQGAHCIADSAKTRWSINGGQQPPCFSTKVKTDCGGASRYSTGTLIMDEYLQTP